MLMLMVSYPFNSDNFFWHVFVSLCVCVCVCVCVCMLAGMHMSMYARVCVCTQYIIAQENDYLFT